MAHAASERVLLSQRQNALLVFLLERLPVLPTAELVEASFRGSSRRYCVGFSELNGDSRVRFFFTLPEDSGHVLMAISDGEAREVANLLANLQDYELEGASLAIGSYVAMPSTFLQRHGRVGALLLAPATLGRQCSVPAEWSLEGRELRSSLVVFLSEDEQEYRKARGHDALMDRFQRDRRDLITLNSVGA